MSKGLICIRFYIPVVITLCLPCEPYHKIPKNKPICPPPAYSTSWLPASTPKRLPPTFCWGPSLRRLKIACCHPLLSDRLVERLRSFYLQILRTSLHSKFFELFGPRNNENYQEPKNLATHFYYDI